MIVLSVVFVGILYYLSGQIKWENKKLITSDQAKRHVLFLMLLMTIVIAWNFWLARFQILFSNGGLIAGADFTDAKVVKPAYYVMIAVSLLTAVFILLGIIKKSLKQFFIGGGILLGSVLLFIVIIPALVQQFSVRPNELQRESPYIKDNIEFTREGYNLNNVIKEVFPVEDSLTAEDFTEDIRCDEN